MSANKYEVGYKKPPAKNQFKPGTTAIVTPVFDIVGFPIAFPFHDCPCRCLPGWNCLPAQYARPVRVHADFTCRRHAIYPGGGTKPARKYQTAL